MIRININVRTAALTLLGLAAIAAAPLVGHDGTAKPRALAEATLAKVTGTNPNRLLVLSNEYCSSINVGGGQVPSYGCAGFPTATCILCRFGRQYISGIYVDQDGGGQASGGMNGNCTQYEKWTGECNNDGTTYFCEPLAWTLGNCTGTFPFHEPQIIGRSGDEGPQRGDGRGASPVDWSIAGDLDRLVIR